MRTQRSRSERCPHSQKPDGRVSCPMLTNGAVLQSSLFYVGVPSTASLSTSMRCPFSSSCMNFQTLVSNPESESQSPAPTAPQSGSYSITLSPHLRRSGNSSKSSCIFRNVSCSLCPAVLCVRGRTEILWLPFASL